MKNQNIFVLTKDHMVNETQIVKTMRSSKLRRELPKHIHGNAFKTYWHLSFLRG